MVSWSANVTKPKPRERPVCLFFVIVHSSTAPNRSKYAIIPSVVVDNLRPPTNTFLAFLLRSSSTFFWKTGLYSGTECATFRL